MSGLGQKRVSPPSDPAPPSDAHGVSASADTSGASTDSDVYVCLSHALRAWEGRDDVAVFLVHDSGTSAHLVDVPELFWKAHKKPAIFGCMGLMEM